MLKCWGRYFFLWQELKVTRPQHHRILCVYGLLVQFCEVIKMCLCTVREVFSNFLVHSLSNEKGEFSSSGPPWAFRAIELKRNFMMSIRKYCVNGEIFSSWRSTCHLKLVGKVVEVVPGQASGELTNSVSHFQLWWFVNQALKFHVNTHQQAFLSSIFPC